LLASKSDLPDKLAHNQQERTMISKCQCQSCGGQIEFDLTEFELSSETSHRKLGQTIDCPHCGKPTQIYMNKAEFITPKKSGQPQKVKYGLVFLLSGITVVIVFTILFAEPIGSIEDILDKVFTRVEKTVSDDSKANSPVVSISDVKAGTPDIGGMDVSGIIKNLTDAPLPAVSVRYGTFDDDGNKVDDVMDFIQQIDPGGTWKFKAHSFKNEGKSYRLESIISIFGHAEHPLQFQEIK
jgi:hypothetical protein